MMHPKVCIYYSENSEYTFGITHSPTTPMFLVSSQEDQNKN